MKGCNQYCQVLPPNRYFSVDSLGIHHTLVFKVLADIRSEIFKLNDTIIAYTNPNAVNEVCE